MASRRNTRSDGEQPFSGFGALLDRRLTQLQEQLAQSTDAARAALKGEGPVEAAFENNPFTGFLGTTRIKGVSRTGQSGSVLGLRKSAANQGGLTNLEQKRLNKLLRLQEQARRQIELVKRMKKTGRKDIFKIERGLNKQAARIEQAKFDLAVAKQKAGRFK